MDLEPLPPIARSPFGVRHRHDPDAVRFVEVNHRKREFAGQRAPGRWAEAKEAVRLVADFLDEPIDFVVEATPSSGAMAA
jgi:hypothetical protein